MKKAYILLLTSIMILILSLSIGIYVKFSTGLSSQEFHKDLAKMRGYWAVYGAKELNADMNYTYTRLESDIHLYDINAIAGNDNNFSWQIVNDDNSSIKNDSVYKRTLRLKNGDSNKTESYMLEGN